MLCRRDLLLFVAAILLSVDTCAATCPQAFGLDSAIVSQPCTIGTVTFSQFSFTVVQGAGSLGPGNISVTSQPGPANLDLSSTPLIFAPAGVTIERGIGFMLTAPPDTPINSLTVDTTAGSTNASRVPVRTYICVGAPASMNANGTVSCSGSLVSVDSAFSATVTATFAAATTVGVLHDFYIQAFPNTFGELESLRDTIGTTTVIGQVNEVPTIAPGASLALSGALVILAAPALRRRVAND